MKRLVRQIDQAFSRRFPAAYYRLVQKPRIAFKFGAEKKLTRGVNLSSSERSSVIFFTTQKCASRYVDEVLAMLSAPAGLIHADYDAYVTMLKVKKDASPFVGMVAHAFKPQGYYYGPIGTYRDIPNFKSYRVLLQLRDPRDLLTSLYYSTAFSHALISEKVIRRRELALQKTVDEFVLDGAEEYLSIFSDYCEKILGQENVLYMKYEEMVTDFPRWLSKVGQHLGLDDQATLQEIIRSADFSVKSEDKFSQRRQVTPGDHQRKLQPETIDELDQIFGPLMAKLGY